jgi:hypothetical protein
MSLLGEASPDKWGRLHSRQRSTDDVQHEHLRALVSRSPRQDLPNPDLLGDQAEGHIRQHDQAQTELYEPRQAPSPFGTVNTSKRWVRRAP